MEAAYIIEERDGAVVAVLRGDWTSTGLRGAERELRQEVDRLGPITLDLDRVRRCDTAGGYAILEATRDRASNVKIHARPEILRLLELVAKARELPRPAPPPPQRPLYSMLARLGEGTLGVWADFWDTMQFNGHLVVVIGRSIVNPKRVRWAPLVSLMERAGLDAIPIVAVTSFFIGAVIAFIGANMLSDFGAAVFTVELIGVAMLREFGIVITSVLLAGRSASAFAAEIGAMKMNQEIDAMQVMGVDPFEALVLPRFVALLITIFVLTFIAVLSGLFAGMLVCWTVLDLSPAFYFQRIAANVGATHFLVGISKAPVMAVVVAAIGSRQGMEVGGDVDSLGRRVTSAVVHAIFSIIFLDALFAMIYSELDI